MFGHRRADVVGRDAHEVFAGTNAPVEHVEHFERRVAEAEAFDEEILVRDRNGRGLWMRAHVNPVLDAKGAIRNVVTVLADITESKQMQVLQREVLEAVASDMPLAEVMNLI